MTALQLGWKEYNLPTGQNNELQASLTKPNIYLAVE